jgi:hypothetical protein
VCQFEEITTVELQVLGLVDIEIALYPPPGRDSVLHAESFQGRGGELDAGDEVALIAQPEKIETLTAQRDENSGRAAAIRPAEIQCGPVTLEASIDRRLVKADLAVAPTVLPELRFHRSDFSMLRFFFGLGARLVGDGMLFREPRTQVNQPAAIAAKRPIGRGLRPLDRPAACWAFYRRDHER